MYVRDVMTHEVSCCISETPLDQVAMIMFNADCGSVPVTDSNGRPVGMITDRDITMAAALQHRPLWDLSCDDLTSHSVIFTCNSEDEVNRALDIMLNQRIRRLPVVDIDGVVEGMLSIDDIVACAERGQRGEGAPDLSYENAMRTLKAVCKHHH